MEDAHRHSSQAKRDNPHLNGLYMHLNKDVQDHTYPIPCISHILSMIVKAKVFGKPDLAQGYKQLLVDEATADVQTIIMHQGIFRLGSCNLG